MKKTPPIEDLPFETEAPDDGALPLSGRYQLISLSFVLTSEVGRRFLLPRGVGYPLGQVCLETDQFVSFLLRRHISLLFRQFPLLLFSYVISLRIPWDGKLYALDAKTGKTLWATGTVYGGSDGPKTVDSGIVYFSPVGNLPLQVYDAKTGKSLWTTTTTNPTPPAVVNGVVYSGSYEKLFAYNARTGDILWLYSAASGNVFSDAPLVANGVVYIRSCSCQIGNNNTEQLNALNAKTGESLWNYTISGTNSTPVESNGIVYCTSTNDYSSNLLAFHLPG